MNTIYFQPPGINPEFCEVGMISETDKDYIWYLHEPCKILISEVKIIPKENVILDKYGTIRIKSELNQNKITVVTEILNHCNKLLSEGYQIDTQGLVHWIEDKLLEMEKEQIEDAWDDGLYQFNQTSEEYYKETFKSE